jgi:hypothetical protein
VQWSGFSKGIASKDMVSNGVYLKCIAEKRKSQKITSKGFA